MGERILSWPQASHQKMGKDGKCTIQIYRLAQNDRDGRAGQVTLRVRLVMVTFWVSPVYTGSPMLVSFL
jgi:hypothetical protein